MSKLKCLLNNAHQHNQEPVVVTGTLHLACPVSVPRACARSRWEARIRPASIFHNTGSSICVTSHGLGGVFALARAWGAGAAMDAGSGPAWRWGLGCGSAQPGAGQFGQADRLVVVGRRVARRRVRGRDRERQKNRGPLAQRCADLEQDDQTLHDGAPMSDIRRPLYGKILGPSMGGVLRI